MRTVRLWALPLFGILSLATALAADPQQTALRGHLRQEPGKAPVIETAAHMFIALDGDEATLKVIADPRLKDSDFEALGHFTGDTRFAINHIHLPSLFFYRDGKRLQVSYWCDVCYIRTSSPGKCWCCQKETDLDPVAPEH